MPSVPGDQRCAGRGFGRSRAARSRNLADDLGRSDGGEGEALNRTRGGVALGIGLPLATGAAVACPDRKVVCLRADGSALYTVQALWPQAREGLGVTGP